MKKKLVIFIIALSSAGLFISNLKALSGQASIESIRLTETEIPQGYRYGIIPDFASDLLKGNPWTLDQNAMKKMAPRIYPGAEYGKIASIHMTILATTDNPYGDDIVCYIFTFKDSKSAKEEMAKLKEYAGFNSDRSIVLEKGNISIFLIVDNVKDYSYIKSISEVLQEKLNSL